MYLGGGGVPGTETTSLRSGIWKPAMLSMSFTIPPLMFMSRGELEWRLKTRGRTDSCTDTKT